MNGTTYDEYTVKPGDSFWSIAAKHKIDFEELKAFNKGLGTHGRLRAFDLRDPSYGVSPGDVLRIPRKDGTPTNPELNASDTKKAGATKQDCEDPCIKYNLAKPFLVAVAKDTNIQSQVKVTVNPNEGDAVVLDFGQDATFAIERAIPTNYPVGNDVATLKKKMNALLGVFASDDSSNKAKSLFDTFLAKRDELAIYTDSALDAAVSGHENFLYFSERALGAPGTKGANPSKPRIHQVLSDASWDINKVTRITGLGVPAFNLGDKFRRTGDFANGLGVMINGVQHVLVSVDAYHYDSCQASYTITLRYELYDVFGLDDDDLQEYGAKNMLAPAAQTGISAWWQIQHQWGYAPLITKAAATRSFTVSALK